MSKEILKIGSEVQDYLNNGYDYFKKFCNITKHRFDIKQEVIAKEWTICDKEKIWTKDYQ